MGENTTNFKERLSRNLMTSIELTALCLELRKAFLKETSTLKSDEYLEKKIFSEIIAMKEKVWIIPNY